MQAKISTQRVLHPGKDTLEITYAIQMHPFSTLCVVLVFNMLKVTGSWYLSPPLGGCSTVDKPADNCQTH